MLGWKRTLGPSPHAAAIGLGLAALGRPGYLNLGHGADVGDDKSVEALEARTHEVLDAAYDAGVRYFDPARSYGMAERFLGSWLDGRGFAPGAVTVGSKWGYTYTAGWRVDADPPEVKDLSADNFRRQLAETRELLGERLSLYQIHSATLASGVLEDPAVLDELAGLRTAGVAVGLTVSGPEQGMTIERALEVGGFDTVQATWNLLERAAGPTLQRAHDAGLGIIVKEALANGRLTERGGDEHLLEASRRLGTTPDALAIGAVLVQPWTDVVLSGAATTNQLESNLAARDIALDEVTLRELESLAEPSDCYWEERSTLSWS